MKLVHEKILIGCGVVLVLFPFIGLPSAWKTGITVVVGLIVIYLSAIIYKSIKTHERLAHPEIKTETFTEVN